MSQPETIRFEQSWSVRFDRPFCLLALLCVLMMPSTYKGGASTPHAHSFFQFWFSGADRAFDHHHGLDHHTGSDTAVHVHNTSTGESPAAPVRSAANADDVTIAPESAPGGTVSALALLIGILLSIALPYVNRWRFPNLQWIINDRWVVPESPPPRIAVIG